ncbi:hypothetical protein WUBG_10924 [Wuchereria bancrofti]|uniref:Uncharacterized protein n=1 Tax=Wuchereria bancrofti TaxID=6293 RepID=J9E799_WUCBA|nr:hypothetical protein WUBG_10924 [Wuchereria bancrofti]
MVTQGIPNRIVTNGDQAGWHNSRNSPTLSSPNMSSPSGINAIGVMPLSPTENTMENRLFSVKTEGLFSEI